MHVLLSENPPQLTMTSNISMFFISKLQHVCRTYASTRDSKTHHSSLMLTDFQNFFPVGLSSKFTTRPLSYFRPHLKRDTLDYHFPKIQTMKTSVTKQHRFAADVPKRKFQTYTDVPNVNVSVMCSFE